MQPAEYYRSNPHEFLRLSETDRVILLNEVCGAGKITYKIESTNEVQIADDIKPWLIDLVRRGQYHISVKLMVFFRINCLPRDVFRMSNHLDAEFSESVPFGSFYLNSFEYQQLIKGGLSYVEQWCIGCIDNNVIINHLLFNSSDESFNLALNNLIKIKMNRVDLHRAIRQILAVHQPAITSMLAKVVDDRKTLLLDTMSQMVSIASGHHIDEIVFPCMAIYSYMPQESIPMRRPVWTRFRHHELTDAKVQQTTLTILCMQRFQYAQFPLHRDLIDKILGYAFNHHVMDMEQDLVKRHTDLMQ